MTIFAEDGAPPPTRHPPDELLLDYASGGASAPESLIIAAHLIYCADCRLAIQACDAIGGALLDALEPARLPPDLLNRTLGAIDRAPVPEERPASPPIQTFLEEKLHGRRWRKLPGGYGTLRVPSEGDSGRVWLLKAPAGKGLLRHRHVGDEWTVVTQGAFKDDTGVYRTGDFVRLADGFEHQPMAQPGDDCICLIMVRQSPRYTTMIGKLAAPFVRL